MKKSIIAVSVLSLIMFSSCKKDDDTKTTNTVTTESFETTIDENPANGKVVGSINGEATSGDVTYEILSENPVGAFLVNETTGELSVADYTLFDYETNPKLTAEVTVTSGGETSTATGTVNLKDINEVTTADLDVTIDELNLSSNDHRLKASEPSPTVLGTIKGTTDSGTVTFELTSESVDGAFAVNSTSGELTVKSDDKFDYETNPTLTAKVTVSNGTTSEVSNVTITLKDVQEKGHVLVAR